MDDHASEEQRIEVWQGAAEAAGQSPAQGHHNVACVLKLARVAIPSVHQQIA